MSPLVQRLLEERGVSDVEAFLNPIYDTRHDPFLLNDMDVAVERILKAIKNNEKIAVWHDYDCDGIPGGSLLSDFFVKIGHPARMQVAERNEGYGLNEPGIKMLADEDVKLLITVDCGITDVKEVALANTLGIDVIVTDHHLPQAELPAGIAVINPHRADSTYPEQVLCGTGVAFKLVEGLVAKGNFDIPAGWEKWLLDLVALATVADMVPLTGENRTLVRYGLQVMGRGRRKGLAALLRKERIPLRFITEDDLGFSVAPKINASSRMESPRLGVELLTTTSESRADELANKLVSLNKARKLEGARVAKEVKKRLETMPTIGDIIVMGNSEWRPSLLGIAGNNIVETHRKTVCLWGKDGELIKGSIRSNGDVNVVDLMVGAKEVFADFGGHESSGGFSVHPDKIHELQIALEKSYSLCTAGAAAEEARALLEEKSGRPLGGEPRTFSKAMPETHSGLLTLSEVNDKTYEALRQMAPFGMDNPKPIFRFDGVRVDRIMRFGGGQEHAKVALSDEEGHSAEAIAFFINRSDFRDTLDLLSSGDRVTVDAAIERSYFGSRPSLRLRIEDIKV